MAVTVVDATKDESALGSFLELPHAVYSHDPYYCATPGSSVLADLRRPDFEGAQRVLVALRGGRPVARIVARRSPVLKDEAGRRLGMLGFFEALEDPEAVDAILRDSVSWLTENGAGTVVGPMNGDTWHSYRFNVGPHDHPPFLLEPHNPPYYPEFWERFGFTVLESYYSQRVDDVPALAESLRAKHEGTLSNGYTMRKLDGGRFLDELATIYELSRESFAGNFLYSEITLDEFTRMYAGARRLIDPDLTWFAVGPQGDTAGFLFVLPDRIRAVASMRGRSGPLAVLRYAMAKGGADAINIKTAGVARAHRRQGLFAAMTFRACSEAVRKGYRVTNLCLIKDGNPSGILAESLAKILRRYVLYEYKAGLPAAGAGPTSGGGEQ